MSSRKRFFDPDTVQSRCLSREATVEDTLAALRAHLEPIWPEWKTSSGQPAGPCPSWMACVPTACTVTALLRFLHPEGLWRTVGGRPTARTPHGGYLHEGEGQAHVWTAGRLGGKAVVADLTADQFGGPEVVLAPASCLPYTANSTRPLMRWYAEHEGATVVDWAASYLMPAGGDAVVAFLAEHHADHRSPPKLRQC